MVFSSITFIYYFLPLVLLLYFLSPENYKNGVLLMCSLIFYGFGEPIYIGLLFFSTTVDYMHSLIIEKYRGKKRSKIALLSSILINVGILGFFKYGDFFIENINNLLKTDFKLLGLTLPIGISFFTFQTMSYTIDVYRGQVKAQRNLIKLGTFVTLFPQLIAGPIVRYKTLQGQLNERVHTYDTFAYGVKRFVLGLGKKVLIANNLGALSAIASGAADLSVLFYWLGIVSFTLQIYFDFSAYSDMAIGMGRLFGFHFLENFNYPLISRSVTEFWTRWHISLSTWFKDYVYIPLGGSRGSRLTTVRNILIVWGLTGFWHGASWHFIIWGLYFALILSLEKVVLSKILKKLPLPLQHVYVVLLVSISFVIFKNDSIKETSQYLKGMFLGLDIPLTHHASLYYLKSYLKVFLLAILGATPLPKRAYRSLMKDKRLKKIINISEPLTYIALMIIITGYLVDASFNPFLYFRF